MIVATTIFWNGHKMKSKDMDVLRCVHCGAVTSYGEFLATGSKIAKCHG